MPLDLNEILDTLADKIMERMVKQPAPKPAPVATESTAGPSWLTTKQAAIYLGCSHQLLEGMRTHGGGPPYSRVRNLVRYQRTDLDDWMRGRAQKSTSDVPGKKGRK